MGKKRKQKTSSASKIKQQKLYNNEILRFAGSYLFYIGLFTLLYITFKEDLRFLSTLTADTLSALLGLLGIQSTVDGPVIYLDAITLKVIDECTGIYEILVYSGCVLAYPTSPGKKVVGVAFGTPVMLGINMIRLMCLAFVGMWYPAVFDYVHYYLWQVTLIILVVFVMLIWIEKVVKR